MFVRLLLEVVGVGQVEEIWLTVRDDSTFDKATVERCDSYARNRDLPRDEYMTRLRRIREAVSRIDFVTGPSFSSRIASSLGLTNSTACLLMACRAALGA